jgi:hypothetical protein
MAALVVVELQEGSTQLLLVDFQPRRERLLELLERDLPTPVKIEGLKGRLHLLIADQLVHIGC